MPERGDRTYYDRDYVDARTRESLPQTREHISWAHRPGVGPAPSAERGAYART